MCIIEIESTRFNSLPPILERNGNSKSENTSCRQRSGGEWRGKKTFSDRCDYFQIANTGEEEGTANPSARGVNRDKRRIVLRIQSVTIRAAYGVREGRGEGGREGTWRDNTGKRTLVETSISRTKQIPRQIGRFSLRPPTFLTRHVRSIR